MITVALEFWSCDQVTEEVSMLTPDMSVASTSPAASPLAKVPEAYAPWQSALGAKSFHISKCSIIGATSCHFMPFHAISFMPFPHLIHLQSFQSLILLTTHTDFLACSDQPALVRSGVLRRPHGASFCQISMPLSEVMEMAPCRQCRKKIWR